MKQSFGQSTTHNGNQTNRNCDSVLKGANANIPKKITDKVIKSNKCNQCDYASSHAGNLRQHLKMNSEEKSNRCNQCDYKTSRTDVLRRHLKIHRGEKSNKCNQCDYASSQASDLRTHLKTQWLKIKQMQAM